MILSEADSNILEICTTLPNEILQKQRHICVYLPHWYFENHYESLSDVKRDVAIYKARANVLYLLSELFTELTILKKKIKKKKKVAFNGDEDEDEESDDDEIIDKNNNDHTKYFTFLYNNQIFPRLEVFFEVVKNMKDTVHGFRYLIIINDPELDVNELLLKKLKAPMKDLKKVKTPPLDCEVSHLLNGGMFAWIEKFIVPYHKNKIINGQIYFKPLPAYDSDANIHVAFSFQSSVEEFIPKKLDDDEWEEEIDEKEHDKYICDAQSKKENYMNEMGKIVKFPVPVTRIPLEQFSPHHLAITRLPHLKTPPQRRLQLKNESMIDLRKEAIAKLHDEVQRMRFPNLYPPENLTFISQQNDEFNLLRLDVAQYKKEVIAASLDKTIPDEVVIRLNFTREKDNHVLDQFNYICNPDRNINDTMKSIIRWGQDNMENMKEFKKLRPIDPTLSPFANMTAYMMDTYDRAGVIHLHGIIHLIYVNSLGALSADNRGIHTHVGCAGAHSVGKSYSLDHVADSLLIAGTFYKLLRLTPQSLSTGTDFSNKVFFFHEIPNNYLGINENVPASSSSKDQGDALVKQILSGESQTTLSAHTDNVSGKRLTIETTINQRCVFIGAMNIATFLMAAPIRARYLLIDVPKKTNKNRSLAFARLEKNNKIKRPSFFHLMMQYLVFKVVKCIETGLIPDVNMEVALLVFNDVLQKLNQEYGFNTNESRDLDRLCNMARTLTIANAIFVGYFMYDKKMDFEATPTFLGIQDYLVCTEEIAIFTLTALSGMFLSDTEDKIVRETTSFFSEAKDKFGYMCYNVKLGKYKTEDEILKLLVQEVKKSFDKERDVSVEYSEEMIMNVYVNLRKRQYNNDDILSVDVSTGVVYIKDDFRQLLKTANYQDLMINMIKESCQHKFTKENKRVMTGYICSDDHPSVYKMIDLVPNTKIKKLITGTILEEDIDDYYLEQRIKECGGDLTLKEDMIDLMRYEYEEYKEVYPKVITENKNREQKSVTSEFIEENEFPPRKKSKYISH